MAFAPLRWLRRLLTRAPASDVSVAREAHNPFVGDIDPDEAGYRSLGSGKRKLDLSPERWRRHVVEAYWAWYSNPIARRYIQILKDFTVGDGIGFTATDHRVQEVIDEHWDDPRNGWDLRQFQRVQDMCVFGELVLLVHVNRFSGKVSFASLMPTLVEEVVTDPQNAERVTHLRLSRSLVDAEDAARGALRGYENPSLGSLPEKVQVIDVDCDPVSPTYGRLMGDRDAHQRGGLVGALYFPLDTTTASVRGQSKLLPLLDWLEGLDRILLDRVDKVLLTGSFVWDILIEGAGPSEIRAYMDKPENREPKPGSVHVHNEKLTRTAVAPDLKAADAETDIQGLRRQIFGGMGVPEGWMSDAGNTNRAGALEAGIPTFRMLLSLQRFVRHVYRRAMRLVVDMAVVAHRLPTEIDDGFEVQMPRVETRDTVANVGALATVAATLQSAEDQALVTHETAVRMFAHYADAAGFEIDAEKELERLGDPANLPLGELPGDEEVPVDTPSPGAPKEIEEDADLADVKPMRPTERTRYQEKTADVAERYGVSAGTVRRWVVRLGCPARRLPGSRLLRFNADEVADWLEHPEHTDETVMEAREHWARSWREAG